MSNHAPRANGRTPAMLVSVAHLDDDERTLVLGILLDQRTWVADSTAANSCGRS